MSRLLASQTDDRIEPQPRHEDYLDQFLDDREWVAGCIEKLAAMRQKARDIIYVPKTFAEQQKLLTDFLAKFDTLAAELEGLVDDAKDAARDLANERALVAHV